MRYLRNKTTYNLSIAAFLMGSGFFLLINNQASTAFSGFATVSYGFYLLAKNQQVRGENRALRASNVYSRNALNGLHRADELEIPVALNIPYEFGIAGIGVDYCIPFFSAIIFTAAPFVSSLMDKENVTHVIMFNTVILLAGACLGLQHYGAHNLRVFSNNLKETQTSLTELLIQNLRTDDGVVAAAP